MKNVLLVIPPGVRPRVGLHHALDRAATEGSKLIALAILDPSETVRIAARLDDAFLGERVGDRVIKALDREQFARAEDLLAEITSDAANSGTEVVPLIERGDTTEVCERVIRQHDIGYAVLLAERRSWLTRLLSRSPAVNIPAFEGCEIKVVEETLTDDPEQEEIL
jgi:nucleotide-binding universal stress UspA family protein